MGPIPAPMLLYIKPAQTETEAVKAAFLCETEASNQKNVFSVLFGIFLKRRRVCNTGKPCINL